MNHNQWAAITAAIETILVEIGENPQREELQRTPARVADMFAEIFAGYESDPQDFLKESIFAAADNDMVVVKNITFYSMCEHHMLPFYGRVHVAYLPAERIVGLSQIPRMVEMYARRLQVQERLTAQIAALLQDVLQPRGVGVMVEGSHLCAMMRGVKKEQAQMVTRSMTGLFQTEPAVRAEFLSLVAGLGN
ncbi:MAG: GTP cyclohydrolase I FolE [Chloroflexota bacterium]